VGQGLATINHLPTIPPVLEQLKTWDVWRDS